MIIILLSLISNAKTDSTNVEKDGSLEFVRTSGLTYESGDAASADGGLEVALQLLLDGAGGVKSLCQQDDGVHEEEGGDAVDDVLKDLDADKQKRVK